MKLQIKINPLNLKLTISTTIFLISSIVNLSAQSSNYYDFKSLKYSYTVQIPVGFEIQKADSKNIDLKAVHNLGHSVLVNVTNRLPEEYSITAHDYTAEFLENTLKQVNPYYKIFKSEKIIIDGQKAFLVYHTNRDVNLTRIECYIYNKDYAYLLSGTAKSNEFSRFENDFLYFIKSIKF